MSVSVVLLIAALGGLFYGAVESYSARGFLTPQALAHPSKWMFWSLGNFLPEGQRLLRRGRWIQGVSIALLLLAPLL